MGRGEERMGRGWVRGRRRRGKENTQYAVCGECSPSPENEGLSKNSLRSVRGQQMDSNYKEVKKV